MSHRHVFVCLCIATACSGDGLQAVPSEGAVADLRTGPFSNGGSDAGSAERGTPADDCMDTGPIHLPKFVGNITTRGVVRPDFELYWDQLTPENEGKWGSIERTRDVMNWDRLDAALDYASEHGLLFKEHTLVWGQQAPGWMAGLPASEQAAEVEEWIRLFCERYPDVPLIDVVNEPYHATPSFADAIGGEGATGYDWVIWSFEKARQYCPQATLILNDYNVLRWDTDRFIALADLVNQAGLLDAVGAQAHGIETLSLDALRGNLARVAAVGVPIYITEYDIDIVDDAQQRAVMERQFPVFWNSTAVAGITLWGYIHGATWRPDTGLIRDGAPRPAMTWLMDYLNR